jgi:hypothetical protein
MISIEHIRTRNAANRTERLAALLKAVRELPSKFDHENDYDYNVADHLASLASLAEDARQLQLDMGL